MPKRNAMETTHPEHKLMLKTIHLKEAAVGDNGRMLGELMVPHPPKGQKILDQTNIHDNYVHYALCIIRI